MNKSFQKINIEGVLFFDGEMVRGESELGVDSKLYELFQKKTRNRDTDEYLTDEELQEEYRRKGGLKRTYNKIVTLGIGYVRGDKVYIKSLVGTEAEVIEEFCNLCQKFEYLCGYNILSFDLPIVVGNGMKYVTILV